MTRSYRKTPIRGVTCAKSEKEYKKIINKALRRKNRIILKKGEPVPYIIKNEYMTKWDMPKDGKCYVPKDPKRLRK